MCEQNVLCFICLHPTENTVNPKNYALHEFASVGAARGVFGPVFFLPRGQNAIVVILRNPLGVGGALLSGLRFESWEQAKLYSDLILIADWF